MRLTEEQEELRLAGLRILARLIVRAYLTSQLDDIAEVAGGAAAEARPMRRPRRPGSGRRRNGSRNTGASNPGRSPGCHVLLSQEGELPPYVSMRHSTSIALISRTASTADGAGQPPGPSPRLLMLRTSAR